MAFGKKNKIEIQYYVDQIDKLKEENASLNALINDQSIELKHYKAFFNSNSKLLEASNRMNIACGDIQDAFDNLIDHAEAIRFPDQQNINSYEPSENFSDENLEVSSNNSDTDKNVQSNNVQSFDSDNDVIIDSFSTFFDDDKDPDHVEKLKNDIAITKHSPIKKDQIKGHEHSLNGNDTNAEVLDMKNPPNEQNESDIPFQPSETITEAKNVSLNSDIYSTKSEIIAGHVDSLFAIDEFEDHQMPLNQSKSSISSGNVTTSFEEDDLFEESEITDDNSNDGSSIHKDNPKTPIFSSTERVMTETKSIKTIDEELDDLIVSKDESFNNQNKTKFPNVENSVSIDKSASDISMNVDQLFDEELIISDEITNGVQVEDIKPINSLSRETLSQSQLSTEFSPEKNMFDEESLDSSEIEFESESLDDSNAYVYESTPKGKHIIFDESNDGFPIIDNKNNPNSTNENDNIFTIDDISENDNVDTDVLVNVSEFNANSIKKAEPKISADEGRNHISNVRARIASIDLHEEVAWIKPKRNPRKRKTSYLSKEE